MVLTLFNQYLDPAKILLRRLNVLFFTKNISIGYPLNFNLSDKCVNEKNL